MPPRESPRFESTWPRRLATRSRQALLLYRTHLEHDEDFFVGSREDVLRKVNGEWKIAKRTIVLDANVIHAKNLSVFF